MASRQILQPLARAAGRAAPRRSIFAGQDAWRKHPMLTNCVSEAFPGVGYATVIFSAYLVVSHLMAPPAYHSHKTYNFTKEDVGEVPEIVGVEQHDDH